MPCTVCGATLRPMTRDLPFQVRGHTMVILKHLPVLECPNCAQYLIADREFSRVEQMLAHVNGAAELEILRYGASLVSFVLSGAKQNALGNQEGRASAGLWGAALPRTRAGI